MQKIYEQHEKAFSNVQAFVILKDGERVATIAFKFPKNGAGRLYAYIHWFGTSMIRGHANGYGYDKKSAACESAVAKLPYTDDLDENHNASRASFRAALTDTGGTWETALRDAGFTVLQAV